MNHYMMKLINQLTNIIFRKYYQNEFAEVRSKNIGDGTKVWQYSIISSGAKIGKNCNICSHCFIENNVIIGDNVTLKNGVYLYDNIIIGDNVFIGPNVTFTNDQYPVSKAKEFKILQTVIHDNVSIGGGTTILPGVTIGHNSIIGAGSIITTNIPCNMIYYNKITKILYSK